VLALIIKTFFVQAFYIPSGSMEQTLDVNDRILVEKVSYWFGEPQRGDIIVFKDPGDWLGAEGGSQPSNPLTKALSFIGLYPEGGHLVKRVIGVGGDHVRCHDGVVQVNGVNLDEKSYVTLAPEACAGFWSVNVPQGKLWVLGDNRENSADSRAHMGDPGGGFIPVDDVVGKVFVTVWPVDRWRVFHRPDTFNNPQLDVAVGLVSQGVPLGAVVIGLVPPLYRRARLRWGDPGVDEDWDALEPVGETQLDDG
jgi:signal peptidase I